MSEEDATNTGDGSDNPSSESGEESKGKGKQGDKDGGADVGDTGGGNLTEEIKDFVKNTVREVIDEIKETTGIGTPRRQDIEEQAASLLERAVAKLNPPSTTTTVEEVKNPPKPEGETAPKLVRKVTKFMWGDD